MVHGQTVWRVHCIHDEKAWEYFREQYMLVSACVLVSLWSNLPSFLYPLLICVLSVCCEYLPSEEVGHGHVSSRQIGL